MLLPYRERLFRNWLWRLPPGHGRVALTFDDGPLATTTPQLLNALQTLKVPCTHFLTGSQCAGNASLLIEMRDAGHVLANHGFHHRSFRFQSPRSQRESIRATDQAIAAIVGAGTRFYRPCYGHFNFWTQDILLQTGHIGVLWSLIASDWTEQSDDDLWRRIVTQLHDGAIIVLHDGHPTTPRVIRLLPRLVEEVTRRGWNFIPLPAEAIPTSK
jgi:peptidoglycan-N-acetylglucosamine deacetylase